MQKVCIISLGRFFQNEDSDSNRIDDLPFPIAFFIRSGVLIKANRELMQAAGIMADDLSAGRINFLNRITTENYGVLEAADRIFFGDAGIVRCLVSPVSMFALDDYLPDEQDDYRTALFFPVGSDPEDISCGAVVLVRQDL